jgi:shikimate dehydrogenase
MNITGKTKVFAVLGHPVEHTLSPPMHNASIEKLGINAVYTAFDVSPDLLPSVLPAMRDMGFGGVNLTVPLKEKAFQVLSDLAPSARLLGAVNTVKFLPDGGMQGHNTDGEGFLLAVKESFGISPKGLQVFVLGSGGAGRAVALTCAEAGAGSVTVADMIPGKASKVADEITRLFPGVPGRAVAEDPCSWIKPASEAALFIQASTAGMKPSDASPLPASAFRKGQYVFDLVYFHPQTVTMTTASASGAKAVNGLNMLLYQGARSFEIWTDQKPDINSMRKALEQSVYGIKKE